jgi:hypothetical protein
LRGKEEEKKKANQQDKASGIPSLSGGETIPEKTNSDPNPSRKER